MMMVPEHIGGGVVWLHPAVVLRPPEFTSKCLAVATAFVFRQE